MPDDEELEKKGGQAALNPAKIGDAVEGVDQSISGFAEDKPMDEDGDANKEIVNNMMQLCKGIHSLATKIGTHPFSVVSAAAKNVGSKAKQGLAKVKSTIGSIMPSQGAQDQHDAGAASSAPTPSPSPTSTAEDEAESTLGL